MSRLWIPQSPVSGGPQLPEMNEKCSGRGLRTCHASSVMFNPFFIFQCNDKWLRNDIPVYDTQTFNVSHIYLKNKFTSS